MKNKIFITILAVGLMFSSSFAQVESQARFDIPTQEQTLETYGQVSEFELSKTIKILSWNVKKAELEGWAEDFKKLSADYDLLAIQEAASNSIFLNEIQRLSTTFRSHFFVSWIKNKDKTRSGVLTTSRVGTVSTNWFRTKDLEPIVKTPKITGVTEYKIKGSSKTLKLINIHAINISSVEKLESHLRGSLQFVKNHTGPVVFIGDFNTWSKKRLNLAIKICAEFGLKHYDYERLKVPDVMSDLDRVFVRGAKVNKVEMLDIRTSDHFPVSLEISVP